MKGSDLDELQPLYCKRCQKPTPRIDLNRNNHCPPCEVAWQEEEAQRLERERQERERVQQQWELERQRQEQERYNRDTRNGPCPQCGSRNIAVTKTGGTDDGAQAATCCCGCAFFWPLMLLAPFLFRHPTQTHARCNACGYKWLM